MFKNLQKKWKVTGSQLLLVLITFAVGGSLTGYSGRKIVGLMPIEKGWLWIVIYIIMIILLWPIAVLLISLLTGQYGFFIKYIRRIGITMKIVPNRKPSTIDSRLSTSQSRLSTNIALFASGAGSNAQKIIDHFREHRFIHVSLIVCNNPQARVLKIAEKENIASLVIDKEKFFRGDNYVDDLKQKEISFIVLAGFLWKLPGGLIRAFPNRIINIHPALLPKYGGKGMYGASVHRAVIAAGDKETGITIHYVDENYDNGDVIFQATCPVLSGDTPDSLAQRIHKLEHENYPGVIEKIVGQLTISPT